MAHSESRGSPHPSSGHFLSPRMNRWAASPLVPWPVDQGGKWKPSEQLLKGKIVNAKQYCLSRETGITTKDLKDAESVVPAISPLN